MCCLWRVCIFHQKIHVYLIFISLPGLPRRVQLQATPAVPASNHPRSDRGLHLARHLVIKLRGHSRSWRAPIPERAPDLQPAQEVGSLEVLVVHVGAQRVLSHHLQHLGAAGVGHSAGDGPPVVEDSPHLLLRRHCRISHHLHHGPQRLPRG